MQNARTIILHPMPIALLLSVAVHAAMLHGNNIHIEASPIMESGKTVVQLTLIPSAPHVQEPANALPKKAMEPPQPQPMLEPVEPMPEPIVKSNPEPVPTPTVAEAAPAPVAIEQDAAMEENKGVISDAATASTFRPAYPRISRRRGEEGTVCLSIQVHADGSVGDVSMIQSSGYSRLDKAAFVAARKARFMPALQLGRAIESTTQLSFTFRLTDD